MSEHYGLGDGNIVEVGSITPSSEISEDEQRELEADIMNTHFGRYETIFPQEDIREVNKVPNEIFTAPIKYDHRMEPTPLPFYQNFFPPPQIYQLPVQKKELPTNAGSINMSVKTQVQTNRRTNLYLDADWPESIISKKLNIYYFPPIPDSVYEQVKTIEEPSSMWLTEFSKTELTEYLEVQFWFRNSEGKMQLIQRCEHHPSIIKMGDISLTNDNKAASHIEIKWQKRTIVFGVNFNCTRTCFKSEIFMFARVCFGDFYLESSFVEMPFRRSEKRRQTRHDNKCHKYQKSDSDEPGGERPVPKPRRTRTIKTTTIENVKPSHSPFIQEFPLMGQPIILITPAAEAAVPLPTWNHSFELLPRVDGNSSPLLSSGYSSPGYSSPGYSSGAGSSSECECVYDSSDYLEDMSHNFRHQIHLQSSHSLSEIQQMHNPGYLPDPHHNNNGRLNPD